MKGQTNEWKEGKINLIYEYTGFGARKSSKAKRNLGGRGQVYQH